MKETGVKMERQMDAECKEDTTMKEADMRLFGMLKDHTIKNAIEAAHMMREDLYDAEVEERYKALLVAIERCESGQGTHDDWGLLVDETVM